MACNACGARDSFSVFSYKSFEVMYSAAASGDAMKSLENVNAIHVFQSDLPNFQD